MTTLRTNNRITRRPPQESDRLPPNSMAAEQAVLGCIMLSPTDCLISCAERWGTTAVFYDLKNQLIYDTFQRMHGAGQAVDLVTLAEELKGETLAKLGGLSYITGLVDMAISAVNLPDYAAIVWACYQRRRAIVAATEIVTSAYDESGSADDMLTKAEERVFGLPRAHQRGARPIGGCVERVIERIEHYKRGSGLLVGLPTGFSYWDKLSGGLQAPELIVLGGRPGTGKTSLAMNVCERVAMDKNPVPVGVMSMEMIQDDLTLRLACARTRVNFHNVRTGCASNEELDLLAWVLPQIQKAPIYIDDESSLSLFEVRSRLRAMKQRFGIRLAIVDYLQLISLSREYVGDPVHGYGQIAKGLAASANELNIPIILLSQLSRESEKEGRRPRMSDLKESGDIEAAAHFIGILYPEKLKKEEAERQRDLIASNPHARIPFRMIMEVCKNRNGPSGTGMQLTFNRWCMGYEDRFKPADEKAPPALEPPEIDGNPAEPALSEYQDTFPDAEDAN